MAIPPASPISEVSSVPGSPTLSERREARRTHSSRHRRRRSRSSSDAAFAAGVDEWGRSLEEQEQAVAQFREQLAREGITEPHDYHTLLRFIRARDYDLQKAGIMYTHHVKWRQENGIDTILEDFHFNEREHYLQVYPQGYYKTDRLGRPISIQHLGKVDPKRIKQITTEDRMIKFHVQEYERFLKHIGPVCSKVYGRHIDQIFAILDVKGVTLRTLTGDVRKVVARITSVMQDHYPETLGKTCIINAPLYFQAVWAIVKPLLQPRTVNKVTLLGTKYMDELTKYVDIENIPEYMGGKCRNTLLDDPGPWNDPQVLSMLGMISEENNEDAAEHLQLNEIDAADSPAAIAAPRIIPSQSPSTPEKLESRTPAKGYPKEGSERSDDIRLPNVPSGLAGNPTYEQGSALSSHPSPATLLRRISALEETMKSRDMPVSHKELPSAPPKSLLARVELLEAAMSTVLQLQEQRLQEERRLEYEEASAGCCCVIM